MAEFLEGVVNGAMYVSRGTLRGESIFFQNSKNIFFSEFGQKSLSFPYQNVPGTTIKNGLFSCRLTQSMKWFSLENLRFRRFNWILRGKTPAEMSKKGLQWQKNNWGKWFSTSIDLILEIVMSHRTIFFRILAESFKQGCKYCILRVEINNFRKDIFYWNKLSISIYFRILRKKILDIQLKKTKTFRTVFNMSGVQGVWKNVFFWISHNFTHLFGLRETHSKVRLKILLWVLQTACTCPNERFERNDFLSNLS